MKNLGGGGNKDRNEQNPDAKLSLGELVRRTRVRALAELAAKEKSREKGAK